MIDKFCQVWDAAIASAQSREDALQAKIDALTLEDDMTPEQFDNWAAHQIARVENE
jgi:hypothetical protein